MAVEIPSQWTQEVVDLYEPVRALGKGGFASVLLAKPRSAPQGGAASLVAIKVVGGGEGGSEKEQPTKRDSDLVRQQVGYAHREFEILAELSHPNIMKLLRHWEDASRGVVIMALSYAPGPTLHSLLLKGGRLSFTFARVVAAQLVDAVSYLHSRAVIHRDIKPDNLVVTGASFSQSEIWDENPPKPASSASAPANGPAETTRLEPVWSELLAKWHVTLVDFGFARALSPSDMKPSPGTPSRLQNRLDESVNSSGSAGSISASQRRKSVLDRSVTRRFTRMMSAVGNRAYAAPEVQRNVVERGDSSDLSQSGSSAFLDRSLTSSGPSKRQKMVEKQQQRAIDVTRTLSPHVSLYGLNADAYSVGNTLLHMLTGARPDQNVNELLALESSPLIVLCNLLCGACSSPSKDAGAAASNHRVVQYRRVTDIEQESLRLIRGLTHPDPNQRTTVRTARLYPYVDDVLAEGPQSNQTFKTVDYLQCVLRRAGTKEADKATTAQATAGATQTAVSTDEP